MRDLACYNWIKHWIVSDSRRLGRSGRAFIIQEEEGKEMSVKMTQITSGMGDLTGQQSNERPPSYVSQLSRTGWSSIRSDRIANESAFTTTELSKLHLLTVDLVVVMSTHTFKGTLAVRDDPRTTSSLQNTVGKLTQTKPNVSHDLGRFSRLFAQNICGQHLPFFSFFATNFKKIKKNFFLLHDFVAPFVYLNPWVCLHWSLAHTHKHTWEKSLPVPVKCRGDFGLSAIKDQLV